MAFALTSYQAAAVEFKGPGPRHGLQHVILTVTGTVDDVDFDIGTDAGTFWTAALADTTYGALATDALAHLQTIIANSDGLSSVYCPQIEASGIRAAAASTPAYALGHENSRPNYTFDTGAGLTAYTVHLQYLLKVNILPVAVCYGVGA